LISLIVLSSFSKSCVTILFLEHFVGVCVSLCLQLKFILELYKGELLTYNNQNENITANVNSRTVVNSIPFPHSSLHLFANYYIYMYYPLSNVHLVFRSSVNPAKTFSRVTVNWYIVVF